MILAVIAGSVLLARQVYFLGTDEAGRVALFRGLPYELPFGIDLYSEQLSIGVQASSLSSERQDVVTEHKLRSESDARDIVDDIEDREGSVSADPGDARAAGERRRSSRTRQPRRRRARPRIRPAP